MMGEARARHTSLDLNINLRQNETYISYAHLCMIYARTDEITQKKFHTSFARTGTYLCSFVWINKIITFQLSSNLIIS